MGSIPWAHTAEEGFSLDGEGLKSHLLCPVWLHTRAKSSVYLLAIQHKGSAAAGETAFTALLLHAPWPPSSSLRVTHLLCITGKNDTKARQKISCMKPWEQRGDRHRAFCCCSFVFLFPKSMRKWRHLMLTAGETISVYEMGYRGSAFCSGWAPTPCWWCSAFAGYLGALFLLRFSPRSERQLPGHPALPFITALEGALLNAISWQARHRGFHEVTILRSAKSEVCYPKFN